MLGTAAIGATVWLNQKQKGRTVAPSQLQGPRTADDSSYARCFAGWNRATHSEVVSRYQLGYLEPPKAHRKRLPRIPFLLLVVHPGESIDFADPETGFAGFQRRPPPQRALRIWADDLLSVSHGDDWAYVIDSPDPLHREWLHHLTSPMGGHASPKYAVVFASFMGPTSANRFRLADMDATTYSTLVHVKDLRGGGWDTEELQS